MTVLPFPGLPDTIAQWIIDATGAEIASSKGRAGGGASREGTQLTLRYPNGHEEPCFLTYDLRDEGASDRLSGFLAEASAIAALEHSAMKVPRVIAYSTDHKAMLTSMVPGETLFSLLEDPAERDQVAFDFMRQLAALHNEDVTRLPLKGFPPLAPVSDYLRPRIAALAAKHAEHPEDPLLVFALRWLEDNLPDDPPRTVLVHGDAGPANFLYHEGGVTAVLDWEMTHFGDPMEDLAWIAVRDLFQPFIALPKCFAAYEAAGGPKVDLQRVRWYRTYTLMTLVVDSYFDMNFATGPFNGVLGNNMLYVTSHRRALIDGIAEFEHVDVPQLNLPDCPPSGIERTFDVALDELRHTIVPRVDDEPTAVRLKALARVIKFWQSDTRYSGTFETMELEELTAALGQRFITVREARAALVAAIRSRSLDDATLIRLLHQRMQRDAAVMAPVMGKLAQRSFSPLE